MLILRLLGEPHLLDPQGRVLQLWRPHVAMLAYLALSPRVPVTRSVLAGMLWPEVPESAARAALRQALFRLRHGVGEIVTAGGDRLDLDIERCDVDVRAFESRLDAGRRAEAVAVYSGPFLGTFSLGNEPFDAWAERERARLSRGMTSALDALSGEAEQEGRWQDAIRSAEQWLQLDPFCETAAARLLSLRAQQGDRSGALAMYERFCEGLRRELGVGPGDELRSVMERVQRAEGAVTSPERRRMRSSPAEAPLVGREAEFQALRCRWELAKQGPPQLVVLAGEAGIGKTRLAQEFTAWTQLHGATVLRGRAYEIEREVPYAALAEVLRAALSAPGLAAVDAISLGELGRIVPEFVSRFAGVAPAQPMPDIDAGRVRLLEALRVLIDCLAFEQPVLLAIDDLSWADEATLAALHYIWRGVQDAPLLVLATARDPDGVDDRAMQRFLTGVARESGDRLERCTLRPLAAESIARLIDQFAAPEDEGTDRAELCAALELETGGNPLFLVETLRSRAEGVHARECATVRSVIRDRIDRLSPPARDLLLAAAVLGRRFPFPFAAALARLEAPDSLDALDELLDRRLLHPTGYEYDFVHHLVREAVYAGLGAERRRLLHRQAFERLVPAADGGAVGLERASNLALHARESGSAAEAHLWLARAAELAWGMFAGPAAEQFLEQALEYAATEAEGRLVAERLADLRYSRSRFQEAALTYRQVLARTARDAHQDRLRIRIKLLDSALRSGIAGIDESDDAIAAVLDDATRLDDALLRDALGVVASACLREGRLEQARALAVRAVVAAERVPGEPVPLVRMLLLRAQTATLLAPGPEVLPILDRAVRIATSNELTRELCDAESDRAAELYRQELWDEAQALWTRVIERGEAAGVLGAVTVAHLNLSDVLLRRGDGAEASAHLDLAEQLAARYGFTHVHVDLQVNRALLGWLEGDVEQALRHADEAIGAARELGRHAGLQVGHALRVLALLDDGRVAEARRSAEVLSHTLGTHPTWGDDRELVAIARARMAQCEGRLRQALHALETALPQAVDPYGKALLQHELASCLRSSEPERAGMLDREAAAASRRLQAPLPAIPVRRR